MHFATPLLFFLNDMLYYRDKFKPKLARSVTECSMISIAWREKRPKKEECDVLFRLDILGINNSPDEQDEPREIIIDYQHERSVEGYSWGDREVQHDVRSPLVF